jgi:hypothetical protein
MRESSRALRVASSAMSYTAASPRLAISCKSSVANHTHRRIHSGWHAPERGLLLLLVGKPGTAKRQGGGVVSWT